MNKEELESCSQTENFQVFCRIRPLLTREEGQTIATRMENNVKKTE